MSNKNKTIKQLFFETKKGNLDSKKELIEHYTKLAIQIIKNKYNDKNLDQNKLLEAAIDAINYSIKKYNKTPDKFADYVTSIIRSRLNAEIKFQHNLNTHNKKIKFYIANTLQNDYISKEEIAKYYIKQIDKLIENKPEYNKYDKEELKNSGYLGLATAMKNYKENTNIPFSTFVKNYIVKYISKEIKKQKQKINIPIKNSYNDFINDIENIELLQIAINKLKIRNKQIIFLHAVENYSFEEIGKIYNLTRSRIQHIYKRSLEIIKEEITGIPTNKKKIKKQSKNI